MTDNASTEDAARADNATPTISHGPNRVRGWKGAATYCYTPTSTFIEWERKGIAPSPDFRCGRVIWWHVETLDHFIASRHGGRSAA